MRSLLAILLLASTLGCAGGPPRIASGTPCVRCGMSVVEFRFACARQAERGVRAYDSIECLLGDAETEDPAWLSDYDTRTLHPADSMWVVRGAFPSPMGGGYAAFRDLDAAHDVAARTDGEVARLADWRGRP